MPNSPHFIGNPTYPTLDQNISGTKDATDIPLTPLESPSPALSNRGCFNPVAILGRELQPKNAKNPGSDEFLKSELSYQRRQQCSRGLHIDFDG